MCTPYLSSGRLLSLFAAMVCGSGASQAGEAQQSKIQPTSRLTAGAKQIALPAAKRQAPPQDQKEVKKMQLGDLKIDAFSKFEGVLGSPAFRFRGPNTEIEMPDKASKSILYVHADDIQGSSVGKSNSISLITLEGNVRYRVVQQSDQGPRVLEGTAGHAVLRRSVQKMEFTGGVRTKLTDPTQFSGPATLRTGSLTVEMDAKPYRYTLEGAAATNDIQFTPLQTPTPKKGEKPGAAVPVGTIHISRFRSGDLQFGQAIHLKGAGTTCAFAGADSKTAWNLQGEQFEAEFVPDTSDFQRATVMDNVKFHLTQPSADGKSTTGADGSAQQSSYVRTKDGQELVTHGPLRVNLLDTEHFAEPGLITAEKSATLSLKKAGDSLSYALDDPKQTAKIRIVPKPLAEEKPKATTVAIPK
jgi:hypothetical protein